MRSLIEVEVRSAPILGDPQILTLVRATSTPTSAYDIVKAKIKDEAKARAARWLAIMRRDYPDDYNKMLSENKNPKTQPRL